MTDRLVMIRLIGDRGPVVALAYRHRTAPIGGLPHHE